MKKRMPWIVLGFLFIATGLNFLDRQVLSMSILKIQKEFDLTDVQYGIINTSFLISYAIMFTVAGRVIDKIGGHKGLALSVGIWSVAALLHGVMQSFYQLVAFRFLLGLGEGGCFPGAAKTVYEWFGKKQRALANGIAIGGSAIGAVVAPPLTIHITNHYGWRWGFLLPGIVGIVWVIGWLMVPGRNPHRHEQTNERTTPVPFLQLLTNKKALVFIIIRFLLDPVLYFIMFWTPKFLNEQGGASFEKIGQLFWIPFLALGISNITGGWLSDLLIKKGVSIHKARKTIMGIAAGLTLFIPFIAWSQSPGMAITLITVAMFAHGFWITNYITAISDVFGANGTSTVVGLSGTAGAISSLIVNPLIGIIIHNYSYSPVWIVSGIMYPLAFILLLVFNPRFKPIQSIKI